ncbi:MAG: NADPH-dependent glutamate synthase [Coprothermobacter sp.]|nr:NADPH-dependent glutamate synthase [Coprothermobacter sp.]
MALKDRVPMPQQDPRLRITNFDEVALGYTEEQALAEASRCLQCPNPTCIQGCPVGIDIKSFIAFIQQGKFTQGYYKIKEKNNFPAMTGRVCPQETQCEASCVLAKTEKPIAIGRLERFLADHEMYKPQQIETEKKNGVPVACVGTGPASLAAAGDLAKKGYEVHLFEALHLPGGVLSYGIPEFRLPKKIVNHEIMLLSDLGVFIHTDVIVGKTYTVQQLLREFKAMFLGTGAGAPLLLGVPGENLNGILTANEFLIRVNLMKAYRFPEFDTPIKRGKEVVVVGAGNVAMDAARTAKRLGANVTIVYRRSRAEMPARAEEIEHAEEEGIHMKLLTNPIAFHGKDGWVQSAEVISMELGTPDERGRRRPIPIEGSNHEIPCDQVIVAIGTTPNPILKHSTPDLLVTSHGNIVVDEHYQTNIPGVFAGGDIVTGSATVIEALGAGKRAAIYMDEFIRGA